MPENKQDHGLLEDAIHAQSRLLMLNFSLNGDLRFISKALADKIDDELKRALRNELTTFCKNNVQMTEATQDEKHELVFSSSDKIVRLDCMPVENNGQIQGYSCVSLEQGTHKNENAPFCHLLADNSLESKFLTFLSDTLEYARKQHRSVSVLLLDLSDFHKLATIYGLAEKNLAMQKLEDILKTTTRWHDFAGAINENTFALVLANSTEESAIQFAKRLCDKLENTRWPHRALLTVKIALASSCQKTLGPETAEELLTCAEMTLNALKQHANSPGLLSYRDINFRRLGLN